MDLSTIINIIASVGGIPLLVNLIKKWLPKLKKGAPIVAVVLAFIYVIVAKMLGANAELNTVLQQILLALGISGGSVLTYDTLKTTIAGK